MQTIGERLEEARKKKGISIREAAEATKIRGDYLQKFESNHFDIGLTEIYTRGFLRNYANFLKVPADRIINDYAALGRGDVRPRQPSREIYGRMDISVATAGEASDRAAPPDENASVAEAAPRPASNQPRYPRGSGPTLPSGPDPALVFKYLKWGGIGVILLLVILILKSIFFSGTPAPAATPPRSAGGAAPANPVSSPTSYSYKLIATDPVQVRINARVSRDSTADAEELFRGMLMKGDTRIIPLNGPQNLYASAGQNLLMEFNGKAYPLTFTGTGSTTVDVPGSAAR